MGNCRSYIYFSFNGNFPIVNIQYDNWLCKRKPKYRKKNSVLLYYKDRFNYVERRKSFLISMFDKNMAKEINTFMKKNKISPRDNDELKSLFNEFHSFLNK